MGFLWDNDGGVVDGAFDRGLEGGSTVPSALKRREGYVFQSAGSLSLGSVRASKLPDPVTLSSTEMGSPTFKPSVGEALADSVKSPTAPEKEAGLPSAGRGMTLTGIWLLLAMIF